ncbi:MAG TPA: hypothetical protein VIL36_03715, partial [Acidimicrobiales bacterium]
RALVAAVDEAAADPGEATVGAAVGMVQLARELGVPVDFGTAQERAYEAVTGDAARADPGIRETLRPLTQILGLAV